MLQAIVESQSSVMRHDLNDSQAGVAPGAGDSLQAKSDPDAREGGLNNCGSNSLSAGAQRIS